MYIDKFIENCTEENIAINDHNLVKLTWGNASVSSEDGKFIAIKPSGVNPYDMSISDVSVVEISTGKHVSGKLPSVDTKIHLEIYRKYRNTKSVAHTHSHFATVFAQSLRDIPLIGTTHADYFNYNIPVCEQPNFDNKKSFEEELGKSVVQCCENKITSEAVHLAVLLPSHGVLVWSSKIKKISDIAVALEESASLAFKSLQLNPNLKVDKNSQKIFEFHYNRKNGKDAYYGQ
ncbi:class II aldolase/adducin family protein [Alphaproteobacteria bacterium]|nr:class II aldolase/adducin family protein [Alphaproteobacteria bacterium]